MPFQVTYIDGSFPCLLDIEVIEVISYRLASLFIVEAQRTAFNLESSRYHKFSFFPLSLRPTLRPLKRETWLVTFLSQAKKNKKLKQKPNLTTHRQNLNHEVIRFLLLYWAFLPGTDNEILSMNHVGSVSSCECLAILATWPMNHADAAIFLAACLDLCSIFTVRQRVSRTL